MVCSAMSIQTGGDDAYRLAFKHRKGHRSKVEHDVVRVVVVPQLGDAHVAGHRSRDQFLRRLRAVEMRVRMGRRPGRQRRAVLHRVERRDLDRSVAECHWSRCMFELLRGARRQALCRQFLRAQLLWQGVPAELRLGTVGAAAQHGAPVVDRARRTGRHAGHAEVALDRIDHVVAVIVRDRRHRADRLAGIAADANLGVNQMLANGLARRALDAHQLKRTYSKSGA